MGKGNVYDRKIINIGHPPKLSAMHISTDQVWNLYQSTRIGDTVRFLSTPGYYYRPDKYNDVNQWISGVVLDKYPHHVLLQVDGHRESFPWVELIINNSRKEGNEEWQR